MTSSHTVNSCDLNAIFLALLELPNQCDIKISHRQRRGAQHRPFQTSWASWCISRLVLVALLFSNLVTHSPPPPLQMGRSVVPGFLWGSVVGWGQIGINVIRSCEWGSADICVRLKVDATLIRLDGPAPNPPLLCLFIVVPLNRLTPQKNERSWQRPVQIK